MIRNFLLFFTASFIGICIFFSCSKEDDIMDDKEPPTVRIIHPERDTTIMTDSICIFKAEFTDNKSLSSYSIKIWNAVLGAETDTFTLLSTALSIDNPRYPPVDETTGNLKDSALFNKAFQQANIFLDTTKYTVTVYNGYWIDSLKGTTPYALGEHWFKVTVIDKAGNYSADSFKIKVIRPPVELEEQ